MLNVLDCTFVFPKEVDSLVHKLINELYIMMDEGYPEYDIKSRKLIERIEFEK